MGFGGLEATVLAVIFIIGAVFGSLIAFGAQIISLWREKIGSEERKSLFDKALTSGDPAALYNLRMAEAVSAAPGVQKQATQEEIARHVPEKPSEPEPWAGHPEFENCQVEITPTHAVVYNEDSADGPEVYDIPISEFWSMLEEDHNPLEG